MSSMQRALARQQLENEPRHLHLVYYWPTGSGRLAAPRHWTLFVTYSKDATYGTYYQVRGFIFFSQRQAS